MKDCYKTCHPDRYAELKANAKRMRGEPTEAENVLWQYLRAGQLGKKFRRQHPIGDYIADFVCLSKKLVIEIDGGYHLDNDQKEHDSMRDALLAKLGFRTIRCTNEEVFTGLDIVLSKIKQEIDDRPDNRYKPKRPIRARYPA